MGKDNSPSDIVQYAHAKVVEVTRKRRSDYLANRADSGQTAVNKPTITDHKVGIESLNSDTIHEQALQLGTSATLLLITTHQYGTIIASSKDNKFFTTQEQFSLGYLSKATQDKMKLTISPTITINTNELYYNRKDLATDISQVIFYPVGKALGLKGVDITYFSQRSSRPRQVSDVYCAIVSRPDQYAELYISGSGPDRNGKQRGNDSSIIIIADKQIVGRMRDLLLRDFQAARSGMLSSMLSRSFANREFDQGLEDYINGAAYSDDKEVNGGKIWMLKRSPKGDGYELDE